MFSWLFRKKENLNCSLESIESVGKKGHWIYQCKVRCCKGNGRPIQIVRCETFNSYTRPKFVCSCGERVSLLAAPLKLYYPFGDRSSFHYSNELVELQTGDWGLHRVELGEVFKSEEDC